MHLYSLHWGTINYQTTSFMHAETWYSNATNTCAQPGCTALQKSVQMLIKACKRGSSWVKVGVCQLTWSWHFFAQQACLLFWLRMIPALHTGEGTLGKLREKVCFDRKNWSSPCAGYYTARQISFFFQFVQVFELPWVVKRSVLIVKLT